MNLVVDAHIYRHEKSGGISRVFDNILPRMCDLDPDLKIQILKNGEFVKSPPQHPQITIVDTHKLDRYLRPWWVWKKILPTVRDQFFRKQLGDTQRKIWFSTYYTPPPSWWQGKQVVLVHDFIYEIYQDLMPGTEQVIDNKRQAIVNSDKVICNSNTTASDLKRFYPISTEKIEIVHLACNDLFRLRQKNEIKHVVSQKFILYVGARRIYKDFLTLVDAYIAWPEKDKVKLLVVGRPWTSEELTIIKSNSLENDILLLENCDDDVLCDLYNQSMAFVHPSLYEGFGIPLLEAMACGCPIIASKIPSSLEIAQEIPHYFEPGSVEDLSNAMVDTIADGPETERINKGLVRVKEFTWDLTAKKVLKAMDNVAENKIVEAIDNISKHW